MESNDEDFDNRTEYIGDISLNPSMGKGVDTDMYVEETACDDAPIPISQFDDSIAKSKNANNCIEMFDGDDDAPMPHSLVDAAASSKAKRFGLEHSKSDANEAPIPPQSLEGTLDNNNSRKEVNSMRTPSAPRISQLSPSSSVRNGSNSEQGTTDTIEVLEATLVQQPPLYNAVQVEEQREQEESAQPSSESANQDQTWWKKHGRCVFVGLVFIIGAMAGISGVIYATQSRNKNDSGSSVDSSEASYINTLIKQTGSPVIQPPRSWKPTTTLKPATSPPTRKPTLKPVTSPPTRKPTLKPVAPLAPAEYGPYTVTTRGTSTFGYSSTIRKTKSFQVPYGYMFVAEESYFRVLPGCRGQKYDQAVWVKQWSNCVQCGDKIFVSTVEVEYTAISQCGWQNAGETAQLTWEAVLPLVERSDICKDYAYPCPSFSDKKVVAC